MVESLFHSFLFSIIQQLNCVQLLCKVLLVPIFSKINAKFHKFNSQCWHKQENPNSQVPENNDLTKHKEEKTKKSLTATNVTSMNHLTRFL